MRRALVIATVAALAVARPETYREKEDFQYSRSSSDEGTKSGYYGAQRGNMGGNYERAHNMDSLAQHQMGGLVRTVDGDLGDGAKQKSGSVFSAASSRGVYGSNRYDLSNLQGRNFQEGTSFGDTQSHSSLSSSQAGYGSQSQLYSSAANSAYGSQSQNSRYRGNEYNTGYSDQQLYNANNMQSADNLQSASQYDGAQSRQASGYQSQSGYQGQTNYDQTAASVLSSNAYGSSGSRGAHYRLVGVSPTRVYVRPGSTVAIPIAAQSYDASQGSSSIYDQNSQSSGSTFNQNSINSEREVLGTGQNSAVKPTSDAKRYDASYSYRKEWEKHDTVTSAPVALPTVNPYPSNSELYEDAQLQESERRQASAQEARNVLSNSQYRGYNTKSASVRNQAAYNSRVQEQSSSSDSAAASNLASSSANTHGGYNYGASANLNSANLNSQVEDFGSKPKSYQSSYSYHKSWEHQGDPYVIQPSTNGLYSVADSQTSQRLTSSSLNQASGYGSQQHGSHYRQGHRSDDCDENGHIRVARSYNLGHDRRSYQQSQNTYEGQEYAGQQSQNLEDFGQQSQNLENIGQQSQNLEDFGQQSQNLEDLGQQSQNLEDLGQQSQNLEDLGQQSQNLEDLGQQSQNLQNFGQETQNLEDFGQQSQNVHDFGRIEDLGQQTQNQWDQQSQTDAGQQTQNTWNTLETVQHNQDDRNTEQQQSNEMEHTRFNHQETQGSVFEINHPSLKPESHTTQEDKPNPFAHTIFDEHHLDLEKTESGTDTEKDFPQLDLGRQPGQHTQFYWQPVLPNMNQNTQNVYVPLSPLDSDKVGKEVPDWLRDALKPYGSETHSMHSNTGYGHSQHTHYQTVYGANTGMYQPTYEYNYNPYAQYPSYENTGYVKPVFPSTYGHNSFSPYPGVSPLSWELSPPNPNINFQTPERVNVFTNTQTYNTRNNHTTYSTSDGNVPQESGSTSLTNLWDLIDDIEKQTTSGKDTEHFYHTYQENTETVQDNSKLDLTHNFNENSFSNGDKVQHAFAPLHSTTEPNVLTTTTKQENLHPDVERGDIEPEKLKPQEEAGRGDIGPDDNKPLEILGISPTKPNIYKTPEEIETLSLTKENNKSTIINSHSADVEKQINLQQNDKQFESEFSVLSLNDQKKQKHHSEQDNWKLQSDIQITTSTTPETTYPHEYNKFNVEPESQKNTDRELVNLEQQEENVRQEHNKEQQFESFDQQNVNLDQQNVNHPVSPFTSTIERGPDEIQQNTDQHFETVGQQTEDLNQQSFNQFEDLGQKPDNLGQEHQKFDNFGQQSEGFHQESLGDFGQQSENLGQETQNVDNFGQQSEGFHQESLGDFGQQSENLGQETQKFDNFGQQSEGFHQESLGDFGQQSENLGQETQKFDNFGQQNEGFHQESLGDFGQHEQMQQESLSNFDVQSENLNHPQKEQQLEKLGQENENLEQQSQSEDLWKPDSQQQASLVETFVPPPASSKEGRAPHASEPVVEPEFVTKKTINVDAPPEPVTEKAGFWNKVGSKLGSAKDKVKSWFSRS